MTCPNTQSFKGWPVQLHTKGGYPTAKGERNGKWDKKNTNALTEKELDKLKKTSSKVMMTFLQQGGTMATYWLVGRKEEEKDV